MKEGSKQACSEGRKQGNKEGRKEGRAMRETKTNMRAGQASAATGTERLQ